MIRLQIRLSSTNSIEYLTAAIDLFGLEPFVELRNTSTDSRFPDPRSGNRLLSVEMDRDGLTRSKAIELAAAWIPHLLQNGDVEAGVISTSDDEADDDVFAHWDSNGVELQLYYSEERERFGAWGGVDHLELWKKFVPALRSAGANILIEPDPIRISRGKVARLSSWDPQQGGFGWDSLLSGEFGSPESDGTSWLLARTLEEVDSLRHHFYNSSYSTDPQSGSWSQAVDRRAFGTYRHSETGVSTYLNRIVVIVERERHALWQRAESLMTMSRLRYEDSDGKHYELSKGLGRL